MCFCAGPWVKAICVRSSINIVINKHKKRSMKKIVIGIVLATISLYGFTQNKDIVYKKMIQSRAFKIVKALSLTDTIKEQKVTGVVALQYIELNDIYNRRDSVIKQIKSDLANGAKPDGSLVKLIEARTTASVDSLHSIYLKKLSAELNPAQVEQIKDGMTYKVLPITYHAYMDMLPNLTEEQKKQIMDWLVEAREHAMDGESSAKKHAWFGKYKGRINNYLSQQGYDMKKESMEWEKRIKERQQASQKPAAR